MHAVLLLPSKLSLVVACTLLMGGLESKWSANAQSAAGCYDARRTVGSP